MDLKNAQRLFAPLDTSAAPLTHDDQEFDAAERAVDPSSN
jgi:hypothetical protein